MFDNCNWPKHTPLYLHDKIVNFDEIALLYFPLSGGQFVSNILSCCNELYGEIYFDYLTDLYTLKPKEWSSAYENVHHQKILPAHARYFTFTEWFKFKKIIYINYSLNHKETNWLLFRKKFINHPIKYDKFADISFKYEKELINYLEYKNKEYFNFPLSCLFDENEFGKKINESLDYLNFTNINQKNISKLYRIYMKLNILRSKN